MEKAEKHKISKDGKYAIDLTNITLLSAIEIVLTEKVTLYIFAIKMLLPGPEHSFISTLTMNLSLSLKYF